MQLYPTSIFLLNRTEDKPLQEGKTCMASHLCWLFLVTLGIFTLCKYLSFQNVLTVNTYWKCWFRHIFSSFATFFASDDIYLFKDISSKSITWMYKKEERSISKFSQSSKAGSGQWSVHFIMQDENPWSIHQNLSIKHLFFLSIFFLHADMRWQGENVTYDFIQLGKLWTLEQKQV